MIRNIKPSLTALEEKYVLDALRGDVLSGDGPYTKRVYELYRELFGIENMLLTVSGTAALEMAALLIELQAGDEVIVPSFTFTSTVNAFMLRGAVPVFCDIREDCFNIDEKLIEGLITPRTKAIYAVDYAGVPCDMDVINDIAKRHGLFVIEDAAQAVGSTYKGRFAGTLTELGCFSYHETKNYIMGEGGALVVNEARFMDRAEIIREKGTNRHQHFRGLVDKYNWQDIGSSYLPSDILAAILAAQTERFHEIMDKRVALWQRYDTLVSEAISDSRVGGKLRGQILPENCTTNGHMYTIKLATSELRQKLSQRLKEQEIQALICYVPLHSAPMGQKLGWKAEQLPVTEEIGSTVLRLPLRVDMPLSDVDVVVSSISDILKEL